MMERTQSENHESVHFWLDNGKRQKFFLVGSVAFHASLGAYDTMPLNTVVIFPEVGLNLGEG